MGINAGDLHTAWSSIAGRFLLPLGDNRRGVDFCSPRVTVPKVREGKAARSDESVDFCTAQDLFHLNSAVLREELVDGCNRVLVEVKSIEQIPQVEERVPRTTERMRRSPWGRCWYLRVSPKAETPRRRDR